MSKQLGHDSWDSDFDCVFDSTWYVNAYGLTSRDTDHYGGPAAFYRHEGYRLGHSPNPYFDALYYRSRTGTESPRHCDLVEYSYRVSRGDFTSPHWLFSEEAYLNINKDVADAKAAGMVRSGYIHFISFIVKEIRTFNYFFNPWYYASELGLQSLEAASHFFVEGRFDASRPPTALFDPSWYVKASGDPFAQNAFPGGPYEHYLRIGLAKGVCALPDFDDHFYRKEYRDVAASIDKGTFPSAYDHFIRFGIYEGRNPNKFFNSAAYVERNPVVRRAIKAGHFRSPFEHFLSVGSRKGLSGSPPLVSFAKDHDTTKAAFTIIAKELAESVKSRGSTKLSCSSTPTLSIVVPVNNKFIFTVRFLESLRSQDYNSYEIILVDNASTDETLRIKEYFEGVNLIRSDVNLGYTLGCNLGAQQARGKYVVFANNDIDIIGSSLARIVDFFEAHPEAGAVGGKILSTAGVLQEAGCGLWSDGSSFGFGRGDDPGRFLYCAVREVDFCSGCFLAVRSSTLKQVGLFDEQFAPGYYEETDLCIRIRQAGQKVYYDPSIKIVHFEYASFSNGRPPEASHAYIQRKQSLFIAKHHAYLSRKHLPPSEGNKAVQAYAAAKDKEIVVILEDLIPVRWFGSGFGRTNAIVERLMQLGYFVVIVAKEFREEIEVNLKPSEIHFASTVYMRDIAGNLAKFVSDIGEVACLIVCRTHNADQFKNQLRDISRLKHPPKMILDTEAISSVRDVFRSLPENWRHNKLLISTVRRELALSEMFDSIIYVNDIDRQLAIEAGVTCRSVVIPPKSVRRGSVPGFEARRNFLFLGSLHSIDTPNYLSVDWFIRNVMPKLFSRHPEAKLVIAGHVNSKIDITEWSLLPYIQVLGQFDDLVQLLDQFRVAVVPTFKAGGIPQKGLDILCNGLPMVATSVIARQMALSNNEGVLVADEADMFADACSKLYTDSEVWSSLSHVALEIAGARYSDTAIDEALKLVVASP